MRFTLGRALRRGFVASRAPVRLVKPQAITCFRYSLKVRAEESLKGEVQCAGIFLRMGKRTIPLQREQFTHQQSCQWSAVLDTGWGWKWFEAWWENSEGKVECFGRFLAFCWGRKGKRGNFEKEYQLFLRRTEPTQEALQRLRERVAGLPWRPLFSILLPTYNTEPELLRRAVKSVQDQLYGRWELCIADDASRREDTRKMLRSLASKDSRIRVVFRSQNGHISAASNSALQLARGDFVTFLDHDDELAPAALARAVEEINRDPQLRFLYSDEDKIDLAGNRSEPYLKPDWNPVLLRSQNYVCHLAFVARADLEAVGGFREGTEGCQDWDLFLRLGEHLPASAIRHLPAILYHWRMIPGSTATGIGEKGYAVERARRILEERGGEEAGTGSWEQVAGMYWIHHPKPEPDLVLVPIGVNGPVASKTWSGKQSEVLVFHPEGSPPLPSTAALLAGWAQRDGVGLVAGSLRRPEGGIEEAGLALQPNGTLQAIFRDLPPNSKGMGHREHLPQELAVPGRWWFALRLDLWEERKKRKGCWTFQTAWLALTLRQKGFSNILIPSLACVGKSWREQLGSEEAKQLLASFPELCRKDPASHPMLTMEAGRFDLRIPQE